MAWSMTSGFFELSVVTVDAIHRLTPRPLCPLAPPPWGSDDADGAYWSRTLLAARPNRSPRVGQPYGYRRPLPYNAGARSSLGDGRGSFHRPSHSFGDATSERWVPWQAGSPLQVVACSTFGGAQSSEWGLRILDAGGGVLGFLIGSTTGARPVAPVVSLEPTAERQRGCLRQEADHGLG